MKITPTVAVVPTDEFSKAIELVGGLTDLNAPDRRVVVKVGIYNPKTGICSTVKTVNSLISAFDKATEILVVESDSGAGPGQKRLEVWNECYNGKAKPFNLSQDENTRLIKVAGEYIPFSQALLDDNKTFVSTHVPRRYEKAGLEDLMNWGFVIKNLFGLILDTKKHRFHDHLGTALLDMYEATGGLDLAVLDATHAFLGWEKKRMKVSPNLLLVGKDAFAVEAVGMYMMGFEPSEMHVLKEAQRRGLGEINIDRIDIIGDIETTRKMIGHEFSKLVPKKVL